MEELDLLTDAEPLHQQVAKPRSSPGQLGRSRTLTAALTGAVICATAVGVHTYRKGNKQPERAPLTVARQEAINFFSLDYRHVQADTSKVLALADGSFADSYKGKRQGVESGVKTKKLVVTAAVADEGIAVEYLHDSDAWVLAAVDATTTTTGGAQDVTRYRVRLQLHRANGSWRVTQFNEIG